MLDADVFRDQPILSGPRVRLEPLGPAVLTDYLATLDDPEVQRLTGSHERHEPERIAQWLATRRDHHDRADWAAIRISDGAFLGEAVIEERDDQPARRPQRERQLPDPARQPPPRPGLRHRDRPPRRRLRAGRAPAPAEPDRLRLRARARGASTRSAASLEGRRRDVLHRDGEWHDEFVMSVLASDARATA